MKKINFLLTLGLMAIFTGCSKTEVAADEDPLIALPEPEPVFIDLNSIVKEPKGLQAKSGDYEITLLMGEYLTVDGQEELGRTVFFSNLGNKQLSNDFSPLLSIDGTTEINYYTDNNRPSADLASDLTDGAIDRAMTTWNNVNCSDLGMSKISYDPNRTTGFVSFILGFGGSTAATGELVHCGWMPSNFFDVLAPNGSQFILAVTFTLIYTSGGQPVDTNLDGKNDVAFREIYYNDRFTWRDGGSIDVETVALHEAGHGLSQAHFGTAFTNASNKLFFSPRAVMNATYSGIQTRITATDNGGHCGIWENWPLQ